MDRSIVARRTLALWGRNSRTCRKPATLLERIGSEGVAAHALDLEMMSISLQVNEVLRVISVSRFRIEILLAR